MLVEIWILPSDCEFHLEGNPTSNWKFSRLDCLKDIESSPGYLWGISLGLELKGYEGKEWLSEPNSRVMLWAILSETVSDLQLRKKLA